MKKYPSIKCSSKESIRNVRPRKIVLNNKQIQNSDFQFVYLPEYKLSDRDSIAQVLTCPLSNIYRHDLTRWVFLQFKNW